MPNSSQDIGFIVAAPFSGARRLMHALNEHPAVCANEHQLFGGFFDPRPARFRSKSPRITFDAYIQSLADHYRFQLLGMERAEFASEFLDEYIEFVLDFTRRRSGRAHLVETIVPYPGTSRRIATTLRNRFPNAKIVVLRRDGRDTATEGTFDALAHHSHGTDRYAYFVENRPNVRLKRFFDDQTLTVNATNWAEAISASQVFGDLALQIEYSDLEREPTESLLRILKHFEIDDALPAELQSIRPGRLTERTATSHLKNHYYRLHPEQTPQGNVLPARLWETFFTQHDATLFDQIAGRELRQLGYQTDSQWIENCPVRLDFPPFD